MSKAPLMFTVVILAVLGICHVTAKSLPYSSRVKRISSDQRMAELQALLSMSYRPSAVVGHGAVDAYNAGKRKRSDVSQRPTRLHLVDILRRMETYLNGEQSQK